MELHTSCRKNDCGNCQKNRGEEEEFSHTGIFDAGYDNGSETDRSGECLRGLRTHYDRENAAFSKHRDGSGYRGLSDHDDNSRLFPAERICCRDRRLNAAGCFYYCHGGAGVRSAAVDSPAVSGKVKTRDRQRFPSEMVRRKLASRNRWRYQVQAAVLGCRICIIFYLISHKIPLIHFQYIFKK